MRAIAVPEIGGTPALTDLPAPRPGPAEVLVRLTAAASNPVDGDLAAGHLSLPTTFPFIMGVDGAGRVVEVGGSVVGFTPGDLVHGQFLHAPTGRGTFAEYAAIAESPSHGALLRTPEGLSADIAAAIPTAGMTALGVIEHLNPRPGQSILILGATGGVGVFAVQLAAARGAEVIATARSDADRFIRGLGASQTIDHAAGDVAETVRETHPEGLDAIIDLTRDRARFAAYAALVRNGGAAVSTTYTASPALLASERIAVTNFMMRDKPGLLARITDEVATGRITVPVERTIALDDVPEALARGGATRGARGKTVIRIS